MWVARDAYFLSGNPKSLDFCSVTGSLTLLGSPQASGPASFDRYGSSTRGKRLMGRGSVSGIFKIVVEQDLGLINIDALLKSRDRQKLSSVGADLFSLRERKRDS
jgi:hypothetical protein